MSHIDIPASLSPQQQRKVMGLWVQFPGLIPAPLATTCSSLRIHSKAVEDGGKVLLEFLIKSKPLWPSPVEWEVVMLPSSHLLLGHMCLVCYSTMLSVIKAGCGSVAQVSSCVLETTLVCWCSAALSLLKLFSLGARPHHSD